MKEYVSDVIIYPVYGNSLQQTKETYADGQAMTQEMCHHK